MKIQVVLPYSRQTVGTVIYSVKDLKSQAVGQIYINKTDLEPVDGEWPSEVTLTVEPSNTARQV